MVAGGGAGLEKTVSLAWVKERIGLGTDPLGVHGSLG